MRTLAALMAAVFIVAVCGLAGAQSSGSSGVGGDPSTPRQNKTHPTPNTPAVNRRGDDMAPMQGSNVSNQTFNQTGVPKKKSKKQNVEH
jgi:hypothetical protein